MEPQQFSDRPPITSTGGGLASEPCTHIGVRDRTNGLAKDKSLFLSFPYAHTEVITSLGLPGSIFLSCHLSLPCFRLPEHFHLHNPGLITLCTFVKDPLSLSLSLLPGGEKKTLEWALLKER